MSEAVKRAWRLMRVWKACLLCNTSFLLWQDCQWDWIYIRGRTSDAMMSTPSHTPFPKNTGLRPEKSTDVITKLREKHQLPPRILSGDGELENTLCLKAYGLHLDYPQYGKQVRRATAIKKGSMDQNDEHINCSHSSVYITVEKMAI